MCAGQGRRLSFPRSRHSDSQKRRGLEGPLLAEGVGGVGAGLQGQRCFLGPPDPIVSTVRSPFPPWPPGPTLSCSSLQCPLARRGGGGLAEPAPPLGLLPGCTVLRGAGRWGGGMAAPGPQHFRLCSHDGWVKAPCPCRLGACGLSPPSSRLTRGGIFPWPSTWVKGRVLRQGPTVLWRPRQPQTTGARCCSAGQDWRGDLARLRLSFWEGVRPRQTDGGRVEHRRAAHSPRGFPELGEVSGTTWQGSASGEALPGSLSLRRHPSLAGGPAHSQRTPHEPDTAFSQTPPGLPSPQVGASVSSLVTPPVSEGETSGS